MQTIKRLINSRFLPESIKNKLRCTYHNIFENNPFKIFYNHRHFNVIVDNINLKFYENPYHDIKATLKGYLKKYNIKKGDIIIDAGAYIGAFSLIASNLVGDKGEVIAFEPDKDNYKKLLRNIKLNNATNIRAINKGVWSKNTKLRFNSTSTSAASFFFDSIDNKNTLSVPVISLDSELKNTKINFIKMDIEGAEVEAIKGCKKILENNDVKLAVASYHIIDGQKTYIKIEKLLRKLGYRTETSFPEHLTTYASKQ